MDFSMVLRMKIESEDNPDVVQLTYRDPANMGVVINLTTTHENAATMRVGRTYIFQVTEAVPPPTAT